MSPQADANEARILIPIDQAEELFGAAVPEEASRFFEILNVAMSEDLPYLAVLAQRSDYLEKLHAEFSGDWLLVSTMCNETLWVDEDAVEVTSQASAEPTGTGFDIASATAFRLSGLRCWTPCAKKPSCWRTISRETLRIVRARWSRLLTSQLAFARQSAR